MDFIQIGLGGIAVVGAYVVYIAVTNGVPAAKQMLVDWWNKGKADLATVKADVISLDAKLMAEIETLKADVAAIKPKVGL